MRMTNSSVMMSSPKNNEWHAHKLHNSRSKFHNQAHQNYSLYQEDGYIRKQGCILYVCVLEEQRAMLHLLLLHCNTSYH